MDQTFTVNKLQFKCVPMVATSLELEVSEEKGIW